MEKNVKSKKKFSFNSKTRKLLTVVLVVAVIVLIAMTAAQKLGNMTVSTFTADVKTYFMSLGSGDGYPLSVDSESVKGIVINKSNLTMLFDDKTSVLTSSAKEIQPHSHTYSNPAMKVKGSRVILYDLASGRFRVQNGAEITKEEKLTGNIMAAAIGSKGNYAVAHYGSGSQTEFIAYDRKGGEKFKWSFKDERVIDIDLSANGKFAAVATLNSKDGEITSKLYVFNLNNSEKYSECFDYSGTALMRVNYVKGNNILAVGDNLRSYIKNNTDRQDDIRFDSSSLYRYSLSQNGTSAIALSKYGSTSLFSVSVYNKNNKEKFTVSYDRKVTWVDTDGKYTAVLFDNEVRTYNNRGKQVGTIYFNGDAQRVAVDGGKTYVLTSVEIKCYKTKGTTDERQVSE